MRTYYVHPVIDNHVWVTCVYKKGKKTKRHAAFQIDLPGKWFEDTFNCHVDGCDYECNTLEEALERGAKFYGGEYEIIYIDDPWNYEFDYRHGGIRRPLKWNTKGLLARPVESSTAG